MVTIRPPARLVGEPKKTKKGRKEGRKEERHPKSGKLAIRPDHPRCRIKIKLCMVGGLRCVVIHVKYDPNRSRGYGAVGVENGPFLLLWPVAYTTACTTVQAVIRVTISCRYCIAFEVMVLFLVWITVSFKVPKNERISGTSKIRKIRFLNLCLQLLTILREDHKRYWN